MNAATAIIQVVGLYLLSYQVEPGKLIAIAPRIPCPSSQNLLQRKAAVRDDEGTQIADSAEMAMNKANVEEHEALLVFPAGSYSTINGWKAQTLAYDPRYEYVKLEGERVRFTTSSGGGTGTNRTNLNARSSGRTTPIGDMVPGLRLPHVSDTCCSQPTLRKEYRPDTGYSLAAAVLEFSAGNASSCEMPVSMRDDTVTSFNYDVTFVVEATKGPVTKSISFEKDVLLTFANVPVTVTDPQSTCSGNAVHLAAYGAMIEACPKWKVVPCGRPVLPAWTQCKTEPAMKPGGENPKLAKVTVPWTPAFVTAQCSNNQWP